MATDRQKKTGRAEPAVEMQYVQQDLAAWLGPLLAGEVKGTHDLQISIDGAGRVTLRIRPGYLTISKRRF